MARFRLFDLNDEQRIAVTTTEGPLLILAGAGTGKTRVITARAAYLISQGVKPEQILAVTFTNKAANEMRERLAKMIEPAEAKLVTMSTFHALCVRILRTNIDRLGYKNNFSIYDEGDQQGLIKKIITRTAAKDEKLDPNLAKNLISKAKNNGWSAPEDDQTLLSAVFARYQQELKTLNAVDFDDLLLLTVKLLNEHADVRARWQQRFHYLMVDEFQDTNGLQLELVTLLAKNPDAEHLRSNICVVGDDDQSIYGWRGAQVSNILEFEHHFPNPTIVKLEQNYRSTNTILGTANNLIKNNPRRRAKNLWSEHDAGDKIRLIQMSDDRVEAEFVSDDIQRRNFADGTPWESFAVLYRMNAQSRLLESNLRRLHIPYRLVGGKSFYDRREVKDLLAYASILVNPDDDVNLLRIINTPARGISDLTTERALELSAKSHTSVFKALQSPEFLENVTTRTREAVRAFSELLDTYETRLLEPLADYSSVVSALIEETGYLADLKRTCKTPEEGLSRETNVREMLAAMAQHQQRSTKGLRGFLDEVNLDQEQEDDDDKDDKKGVTLITLHAAKGLEFPHVYLVGLEEGLLPHDRSKVEGTVDEERRLLYVGITRAMKTLTLTHCRDRIKFGSVMPCHPSSFIKEFPEDKIELIDLAKLLSTPVAEETAKNRFAQLKAALNRAG
jgi:superfamily I DNA/RNA helicase